MKAVEALNYQPNLSARKLRSVGKEEYTIGIYWAADSRTIFLARVLKGLQQAIGEAKKTIKIVICPFTPGKLHEDYSLQTATAYNAVIIATLSPDDLDYLEKNPPPIPVVLYNRRSTIFSGVGTNNQTVGTILAEHFLQQGITDICCVHHRNPNLAMQMRGEGFHTACLKQGIQITGDNLLYVDDTFEGGYRAGESLVCRGRYPRAIYCDSDQMAIGMISAFQRNGIRVPEDVQVVAVGIAFPDLCRFCVPSLTVMELPLEEVARGAMNLCVEILERRIDEVTYWEYPSEFHVRESSREQQINQ